MRNRVAQMSGRLAVESSQPQLATTGHEDEPLGCDLIYASLGVQLYTARLIC